MSVVKDSALVSIDGVVVIATMVAAGVISMRYDILDKHSSEMIGRLILNILLPCLIFAEMMDTFTVANFAQFGMLFVLCSLHIFLGVLVGWISAKALGSSREVKRLIMTTVGFQDTTAIPLVFATVLGNDSTTNKDKNFSKDATSIVLIYTVFVTVYKWTVAYQYELFRLMKPLNSNLSVIDQPLNNSYQTSKDSKSVIEEQGSGCWWTFKKIMNPPIWAALISMPLALIPYMKEYVFNGPNAILTNNVYHAITVLGGAVSPMINILLGCNLSRGYPKNADIRWSELISILVGKEVIMPLIGLGLCEAFYIAGAINRVTALMVMVIYASPTSLQLLMICINLKTQVENVSKLYLVMYGTAAIPMALWTMGFIVILYD